MLTELVGLDVVETIQKAIARGKTYQLRCLVADFKVYNGRMETQMLLIDTTDTKVIGGGFIDLQANVIALKLSRRPKTSVCFRYRHRCTSAAPWPNLLLAPSSGKCCCP